MKTCFKVVCLLFIPLVFTFAQADFPACTNRNQPTCRCATAPVICSIDELNGAVLRMSTFQHAADGPNPLCPSTQSVPNNPSWLGFTAWCTDLTLRFVLSNCRQARSGLTWTNGVQVAAYSACGPPNNQYQNIGCLVDANTVCCTGLNCNPPNNLTLSLNNLIIGEVYYLLVDGCGGASCDVGIQVVNACGRERILPWPAPLSGPDTLCSADEVASLFVQAPQPGLTYSWYVNNDLFSRSMSNQVVVNNLMPGLNRVCVDASKEPCVLESDPPLPLCKDIWVADIQAISPPEQFICEGDSLSFHGSNYSGGTYTVVLQTEYGCDSTVQLLVNEVRSDTMQLGTLRICSGDSVFVGQQWIRDAGDYQFALTKASAPFCDSVLVFSIIELNIGIIEDISVPCFTAPVPVSYSVSVPIDELDLVLLDSFGQILQINGDLLLPSPGIYRIQVVDRVTGCSFFSNWFELKDESNYPELSWRAPEGLMLTCAKASLELVLDPQQGVNVLWEGSFGQLEGNTLMVTNSGVIIVSVLDTVSGCLIKDTITIVQDTVKPEFYIETEGNINCIDSVVTLQLIWKDTSSNLQIQWFDNEENLFLSNVEIAEITIGGFYRVVVTNLITGCNWTDSLDVSDLRVYPSIALNGQFFISCAQDSAFVFLNTNIPDPRISWFLNGIELSDILDKTTAVLVRPGSYLVEVTDGSNFCSASLSFEIEDRVIFPDLNQLIIDSPTCPGDSGQISWQEGEEWKVLINGLLLSGSTFALNESGTYLLQITNAYGCIRDTAVIVSLPDPLELFLPENLTLEFGDVARLNPLVNRLPEQITLLEWEPPTFLSCSDCIDPLADPTRNIRYVFWVTDTFGCKQSASIQLIVSIDSQIFVPSAFTPNGDGLNDILRVFASRNVIEIKHFEVFDRWGNTLFIEENFKPGEDNTGWNGTFKGMAVDSGVFTYRLVAKLADGEHIMKAGEVTLIR
jgi:gliding motility-associated-like protein